MHYKKYTGSYSVSLAPNALQENIPWSRAVQFGRLKVTQQDMLQSHYQHESQITRSRDGKYWLCLLLSDKSGKPNTRFGSKRKKGRLKRSRSKRVRRRACNTAQATLDNAKLSSAKNQGVAKPVMSIDPGVRCRHVVYSSGGVSYYIGEGDISRIVRLAHHVDKCVAKEHDYSRNHRSRQQSCRKRFKLYNRVSNLKREIDNKTIAFLTQNARVVLLPSFEAHSMVSRASRKIRSKTARALLCWGHGLFKQRLLTKSRGTSCQVMIVSEHYTSKTCGQCGHMKSNLGGAKVFSCDSCGFECDRDLNGARNILLRSIRKT